MAMMFILGLDFKKAYNVLVVFITLKFFGGVVPPQF
jgi:hypothetical protein